MQFIPSSINTSMYLSLSKLKKDPLSPFFLSLIHRKNIPVESFKFPSYPIHFPVDISTHMVAFTCN